MRGGPHLLIGVACGVALARYLQADIASTAAVSGVAALLPDLDHPYSTASITGRRLFSPITGLVRFTWWGARAGISAAVVSPSYVWLSDSGLGTPIAPLAGGYGLALAAIAVGAALYVGLAVLSHQLTPKLSLAPYNYLEHRGAMHSPVFGCLFMVVLLGCLLLLHVPERTAVLIAVAGGAGWLSHLLADAGTISGLPLFWPISNSMVHVTGPLRFRSGNAVLEMPIALTACVVSLWPWIAPILMRIAPS